MLVTLKQAMPGQKTDDKAAIHRDKFAKEVCTKPESKSNDRGHLRTTGHLEMPRH